MGEEGLMLLLAVVVAAALVGYFLWLRLRLPKTAGAWFESPGVVWRYYRAALRALSKNRWLLGLPLGFALASAVFQLGWMLPAWRRMTSVADAGRFAGPPLLTQLKQGLLQGFCSLNDGYFGAISGAVFIVFLPCVVLFWVVCPRLGRYVDDEQWPQLKLLERILKAALVVLVITLTAAWFLREKGVALIGVGSVGSWVLSALGFCLATLIEGVLLFWARSALAGGGFDFRKQLNLSFSILKPLYTFNLILYIIAFSTLPVVIPLVRQILYSPGASVGGRKSIAVVSPFLDSGLLFAWVAIFTVCAPFVLLWERRGLLGMLKANFQFIGRHLVKYLTFVAVGGLLLGLPSLLLMRVSALVGHSSAAYLLFVPVSKLLRTALGVVFFLALLQFFGEYFRIAEPEDVPSGPQG